MFGAGLTKLVFVNEIAAVQCRSPLTSSTFLFISSIYQTVVVFALQLIYIFCIIPPT